MTSCVKNIGTKNSQNLVIDSQVTVENVGDVFETLCKICLPQLMIFKCNTQSSHRNTA